MHVTLSRRNFLRGAPTVAAGAAALVVAPAASKDNTSKILARWGPTGPKKTIRYGIPAPQWRKLYSRV
jgi:hypothetical protein